MDRRTPSLTNSDASSSSASSSGPPSFEDRPLPPLPRKPVPDFRLSQPSTPLLKSRAWRNMHRHTVLALRQPRILAGLLRFAPWDDLYALFATCSGIKRLWDLVDIRDIILSHYLPGYRAALRHRDLSALKDVDLTLHDLHLLRSSFLSLPPCR